MRWPVQSCHRRHTQPVPVGDWVSHAKFGKGRVRAINSEARITVRFGDRQPRKMPPLSAVGISREDGVHSSKKAGRTTENIGKCAPFGPSKPLP